MYIQSLVTRLSKIRCFAILTAGGVGLLDRGIMAMMIGESTVLYVRVKLGDDWFPACRSIYCGALFFSRDKNMTHVRPNLV